MVTRFCLRFAPVAALGCGRRTNAISGRLLADRHLWRLVENTDLRRRRSASIRRKASPSASAFFRVAGPTLSITPPIRSVCVCTAEEWEKTCCPLRVPQCTSRGSALRINVSTRLEMLSEEELCQVLDGRLILLSG